MRRALPLLVAVLLVSTAACETNRSGHLSAPTHGPLDAPLANRVEMKAERDSQCGSGALTERGDAVIERTPYLQRLDSSATSVLFTVGEGAVDPAALELAVTTPDGKAVGTVEIARDDVLAPAGAVPMRSRVEGLSPFTMYCYQILEGGAPLMERAGFRTAPETGDLETSFGFIAMGDSGDASSDQLAVLEQMFTVDHDFIVHVGDIAYGSGTLGEFEANHFAVYSPLLELVPFFPAPGNHEYKTDRAAPYLSVFEVPENGDPVDPERYYSFDYGPIHFASIDTNELDDAQVAWLADDLAATDQPYVVVFGHHPPYSSGDHGSSEGVRARLAPILAENHVQLMLTGHDHHYERTNPIEGVTYIVTGGGGVGTRPTGWSSFTALACEVLEFVYFDYDGGDLVLHAIDGTGEEFDNLLIEPRPMPVM